VNYRHIYHAGGLADIVKHLALCLLLRRMQEKETPFCAIDTHAAIGLYDLDSSEAMKTSEAQRGVFPFLALPPAPEFLPLLACIREGNPEGGSRYYPGSPFMIRHFLRAADRMIAVEKHPEEAKALRQLLKDTGQIQIHERDAWEALGALLPVPEKRLFVFIDPPFEQRDEMDQAFEAIRKAHARASHGVIALWYPIKDAVSIGQMQERFAASGIRKILRADVAFSAHFKPDTLNGCGMIIINPPWKLDEALSAAYGTLMPLLEAGAPAAKIDWIAT
jgi:23S rRNA (adenine2030-N6)-methyltransferase